MKATIAILPSCILLKGTTTSPFLTRFLTLSIAKFSSKKLSFESYILTSMKPSPCSILGKIIVPWPYALNETMDYMQNKNILVKILFI